MLLSDWGGDETIQIAAMCHACYGTDGFAHAMVDLADRQTLIELIGPTAEALVYLYCSCDRAFVYPRLAGDGPVTFRDRFTSRLHTPSQREVHAFVEITAANELDVLAHNHALLAEHGADLWTLFTDARERLSDSAWRACKDLLGARGTTS